MNNKVKFLRGTSSEYTAVEKDNDTIYFTTDDGKLYIGDKEVSGESITVDNVLSDTSENPVQNKVIKTKLDNKADKTVATTETDGLMSAADKAKLDGIANGNEGYQMPYYIQTGTVTLTTGTKQGVQLTFPTPFKSAPLLLLSIEDEGYKVSHQAETTAFNNLSNTGAIIRAWYTSNDSSRDLPCTVHWAAFGEIEV